jgi:hypothetical protein
VTAWDRVDKRLVDAVDRKDYIFLINAWRGGNAVELTIAAVYL